MAWWNCNIVKCDSGEGCLDCRHAEWHIPIKNMRAGICTEDVRCFTRGLSVECLPYLHFEPIDDDLDINFDDPGDVPF